MTGTAHVIRADSRHLPLADNTVDLVVTSPPYFALRSYQDGGEHYDGQIGDEPTPDEFVSSLLEVTAECVRVLKPTGSLFVNLGDKYATYAGNRSSGRTSLQGSTDRSRPVVPRALGLDGGGQVRSKSLMGIPWRYALRCIDDLGLILRAELIWSKPNGMPESVTDRVRRSHEQWFHFTLEPRYYQAVDEIREAHAEVSIRRAQPHRADPGRDYRTGAMYGDIGTNPQTLNLTQMNNPLGKLPGSVWTIPTEPLHVPEDLGVDHYAAFPTEWPKRIIEGWSPREACTVCGEGRRPVAVSERVSDDALRPPVDTDRRKGGHHGMGSSTLGPRGVIAHITGYTCACADTSASSTPGVVLDPFGGTGTTAMVAKALGRDGISVDKSGDYCRIGRWRTTDRNQLAKVVGIEKVPAPDVDQLDLFGGAL